MDYKVGDTIGKYTVCGELGRGQFGAVYLVEWYNSKGAKQQGALKILMRDPSIKDILEEVSTWARVSHHPNILTFIRATEHNKQILLISECATGGSLEGWLESKAGKQEAIESAVRLMLEVLCGLEHLHDNGIVHRDIKPANILLQDDKPLLADFGFARGLDLVQSSILGGTLVYMSPELINVYFSRAMGTQSTYERTEADDQWAAAVTLYQMLAGYLPFKAVNDIVSGSPAPLPAHVPRELHDFVAKALQKETSRRFQTAQEMGAALGKAWAGFKQRVEKETFEDHGRHEQEGSGGKAEQAQLQPKAEQHRSALELVKHREISFLQETESDLNQEEEIRKAEKIRILKAEEATSGEAIRELREQILALPDDDKPTETEETRADIERKRQQDKEGAEQLPQPQVEKALRKKKTRKYFIWIVIAALSLIATLGVIRILLPFASSRRINTYFARGMECREKKDYDCAIDSFTKAIDLNPQYVAAYNQRGYVYTNKGNYDQAINDYNKAIELNPQTIEAYFNRGYAYTNKGGYDQAIKDYDKAIELNPQYFEAYLNRGFAYSKKGDYAPAIKDYNSAIELKPQYVAAFNQRGSAYINQGKYDQAITDYNTVLDLNPNDAFAFNQRGYAYSRKGNYNRAIADYDSAIKLNQGFALAYSNRAWAYVNRGAYFKVNYDQAMKDYNKAIDLNPQDAVALNTRGQLFYYSGKYKEAVQDYTGAISSNPRYTDAYINLGEAYLSRAHFDQVVRIFTELLKVNPQKPIAYYYLAEAYASLGQRAQARAARQKYAELSRQG